MASPTDNSSAVVVPPKNREDQLGWFDRAYLCSRSVPALMKSRISAIRLWLKESPLMGVLRMSDGDKSVLGSYSPTFRCGEPQR